MIVLSYVNKQISEFIPEYEVYLTFNRLPRIEIYHQIPSLEVKFVYLIAKKNRDFIYLKVGLDGEVLEIYPNLKDWKVSNSMPNYRIEFEKVIHDENTIPYVSFDICSKTFPDLYYVEKLKDDFNEIKRINNSTGKIEKTYYRIDNINLLNTNFMLTRNSIDFIESQKPDSLFLYYKEKNLVGINLSYSYFNTQCQLQSDKYITK